MKLDLKINSKNEVKIRLGTFENYYKIILFNI